MGTCHCGATRTSTLPAYPLVRTSNPTNFDNAPLKSIHQPPLFDKQEVQVAKVAGCQFNNSISIQAAFRELSKGLQKVYSVYHNSTRGGWIIKQISLRGWLKPYSGDAPDVKSGACVWKILGRVRGRASEQSSDRATERSNQRPSDRAVERSSDRATERASDRATERLIDLAT